jgi:hypothetical protein
MKNEPPSLPVSFSSDSRGGARATARKSRRNFPRANEPRDTFSVLGETGGKRQSGRTTGVARFPAKRTKKNGREPADLVMDLDEVYYDGAHAGAWKRRCRLKKEKKEKKRE